MTKVVPRSSLCVAIWFTFIGPTRVTAVLLTLLNHRLIVLEGLHAPVSLGVDAVWSLKVLKREFHGRLVSGERSIKQQCVGSLGSFLLVAWDLKLNPSASWRLRCCSQWEHGLPDKHWKGWPWWREMLLYFIDLSCDDEIVRSTERRNWVS